MEIGIKNPYNNGPMNNPPPYSASKAGVIKITKYFSHCWSKYNLKINAFCPGGVYDKHNKKFVNNYSNLVPLGRMANRDEYLGPIAYLMSKASNGLSGKILVVDGGKTSW